MRKFYFINDNGQQEGPYTIEELSIKNITAETLVWTEGLSSWEKAANIQMLQGIIVKESNSFSLGALISTLIFAYFAYNLFHLAYGFEKINDALNSENFLTKFLVKYFNSISEDKFSDLQSFFHFWFWALFISYIIKTIFSFLHISSPLVENIKFIGISTLVLEVAPIFFKSWQYTSFDKACGTAILFIPTMICILIMHPKLFK